MSTEVAKKEQAGLPADMSFMSGYQGPTGLESLTAKDVKQPYLVMIHKAVMDGKTLVTPPGVFVNSLTKKNYGESVRVSILKREKAFVEWQPNGGDFVGRYTELEAKEQGKFFRQDGARWYTEEGNLLAETHYYYVVLPDHPEDGVLILGLKSTQIKHARTWNTFLLAQKIPGTDKPAPIFLRTWTLTLNMEKNDVGQEYASLGIGKQATIMAGDWITAAQFEGLVKHALEFVSTMDLGAEPNDVEAKQTEAWEQ